MKRDEIVQFLERLRLNLKK